MEKMYVVVQFGKSSKKTGKPYSIAFRLYMAADGDWARVDPSDKFFTDDVRSIGEIIKVKQTEVA